MTDDVTDDRGRARPFVFAVLITLLMLVFPVGSGAIATIMNLDAVQSRLTQAAAFAVAAALGLFIARQRFGDVGAVGLQRVQRLDLRALLWLAPIVAVELSTLAFGFKPELNSTLVASMIVLTAAVGFAEELYFRGLIPAFLTAQSVPTQIVVSSALFSVGHFFNLMAGAPLGATLLQVVFAFIFGAVAVQIRMMTGSLLIPVIWHVAHNLISQLTNAPDGSTGLLFGLAQGTVLAAYAIWLWARTGHRRAILR